MCYPLPGPRCSSHTRASLIAARAAWREAGTPEAKERYLTARDEYDTSPEGIARNRSLLEHHIQKGLSTRYVKARLAMGEQTRTEGIEAMAEQGITVEEEEAVTPYDETGRDVEGFDAAGQDAQGTTVEAAEANLRRQVLSESDYQFLKEMGPSYWSPADRKALQDYSAAQAALNVATAESEIGNDASASRIEPPEGIVLRPWSHPTDGTIRYYLNEEKWGGNAVEAALGYNISRYNTGNISAAEYNGAEISNSRANRELAAIGKVWIEVADGEPTVKNNGSAELPDEVKAPLVALYKRESSK